jgi:hypothetical protein
MDEERREVRPSPEPDHEVSDPHTPPLDNDDDARWLEENDPRRIRVESHRGRRFGDRIRERLHREED